MTSRPRLAIGLLGVVVIVSATAAVMRAHGSRPAGTAPVGVPVATTPVVQTDLASTSQLSGTLGYAGSYTVIAQGPGGTITAAAQPGQTIVRGQTAYEVDGQPVRLFYGVRPAWRSFSLGMTPGPDVQQLEENLTALGDADARNLTVDETFTAATAAAIGRWQRATGSTVTGVLTLGGVSFLPGPIRVASVLAAVGSRAQPGTPVLAATSPSPVVNVAVPAGQTFLVHPGDAVTVTLPAGNTTPGRVDSVSTVATATASPSSGPGGGNGSQGPGLASIPAVVSLTQPAAASDLDQAPVTVTITDQVVRAVLAVPVTALVALAGGGYAVYVDRGPSVRRLVPVTPGLFATTLVQVTTNDLQPGDAVEVPAP